MEKARGTPFRISPTRGDWRNYIERGYTKSTPYATTKKSDPHDMNILPLYHAYLVIAVTSRTPFPLELINARIKHKLYKRKWQKNIGTLQHALQIEPDYDVPRTK